MWAMMFVMPVVLLVVFGYAASFDVSKIPTVVAGPQAARVASTLGKPFDVVTTAPSEGNAWARDQLRDGKAAVAVVTPAALGGARPAVLIDGSQLFTARSTLTALSGLGRKTPAAGSPAQPGQPSAAAPKVTILFNPKLRTADIMIPGLAGVILVFVGTIVTSLGVVRERQSGTMEQLAVMPLRPRDVFLGKIVPYFAVATLDLGVLISSVSQNQGQAIQMAVMVMLPQILLSGLIFPLSSIVAGVRWISYVLPLTYFVQISRGVMLRAEPIGPLWQPFLFLALLGGVVVTLATVRFGAYLAPSARHLRAGRQVPPQPVTADSGGGLGAPVPAEGAAEGAAERAAKGAGPGSTQ